MEILFDAVKWICAKLTIVNNFFWEFPTNLECYSTIPILGKLPFSMLLLIGSGIYFSVALKFVQIKSITKVFSIFFERKKIKQGFSPLSALFLSTAMRVGSSNILGVTGAVSTGGPGALFWMWFVAFWGMASSFVEATLAQIFKVKKGDQYLGGFSYYGKFLVRNSTIFGMILSVVYIIYACFILSYQSFGVVSSVGEIASLFTGNHIEPNSMTYWITSAVLIVLLTIFAFGGIRFIVKQTNRLVPSMVIAYIFLVITIICLNFDRLPWFFYSVFTEAFKPEAVFGGAFGIAIYQGVKRGLASNEAGQGTVTMAAATAETSHPCEQGYVQAFGVFIDTMIVCTMTGFVVVMGRAWQTDMATEWFSFDQFSRFTSSVKILIPNVTINGIVIIIFSCCLGLFSFTTLLGLISFSEICANLVSQKQVFLNSVRIFALLLAVFGLACNIAGIELNEFWNLTDLVGITITYVNIPILYVGFKYVKKAQKHYEQPNRKRFTSKIIGIDTPTWNE